MKKNNQKAHVSIKRSDSRAEDLAKNLKKDLNESEAELEKDIKKSKESGAGATIFVLVILAILVIVVGFIIKVNVESAIQNKNLTDTLNQINKNYNVDINRLGFIPAIIEINKGDTIIWKNQNFSSHKIIFDRGETEGFEIEKSEEYSITFNEPGVYEYHSATQTYMRGRINVSP